MSRVRVEGAYGRMGMVALGLLAWGLLSASACQETKKPMIEPVDPNPPKDMGSTTGETKEPEGAELPADGSIKPIDVGPPAPALFMMGGMKGYIEPCGCTADILLGGVERIVGYVEQARGLYPASALVVMGDMLFEEKEIEEHRRVQERRKAELMMDVHKRLGTAMTTPGRRDVALGVDYYLKMIERSGMEIVSSNVTFEKGPKFATHKVFELEGVRYALVPVTQPEAFEGFEGVTVTEPIAAVGKALGKVKGADVTVLMVMGKLALAKTLLEAYPDVDFAHVGEEVRETDQIYEVGLSGHTLEVYDQGRYLGILKYYEKGERKKGTRLVNARPVSKSELEAIEERLATVHETIKKLPPAAPGEEPPLLKKLREQVVELEEQKIAIKNAKVEVPEGEPSFIWRVVPMRPGLPVDSEVKATREAYNKSLKDLMPDVPIPEPVDGQAYYVGTQQCAQCHAPAVEYWKTTNHSHAIDTLIERDKQYDQNCVGCHVVGYEKPGGSVVGKLSYEYMMENGVTIQKELANVGCEACHGPGSDHVIAAMSGKDPKPHISREVPESHCAGSCHVPEHSPKFNYPVYRQQILGPGHGGK